MQNYPACIKLIPTFIQNLKQQILLNVMSKEMATLDTTSQTLSVTKIHIFNIGPNSH